VTKHGLADALRKATSPGSDLASKDVYTAIVAALDRLLQANISATALRPGLDAEDVILALAGLWQLDPASDWRAQAQRIYDIVLGWPTAVSESATEAIFPARRRQSGRSLSRDVLIARHADVVLVISGVVTG
jgi:hypothetical protein